MQQQHIPEATEPTGRTQQNDLFEAVLPERECDAADMLALLERHIDAKQFQK